MSACNLTDAAGNSRIADLEDLLRTPPEFANREIANSAADNALYPIIPGVRAIGDLLWQAAQRGDGEISAKTLNGIGGLLMHLADFYEQVEAVRQCTREYNPAHWIGKPSRADFELARKPTAEAR